LFSASVAGVNEVAEQKQMQRITAVLWDKIVEK